MNTTAPDLALIGAGYWGRNLARNFLALGALHTVCDTSPDILAGYGPEYDAVRKVQDPALLWDDPAITKVAIATPAVTHYPLARAALFHRRIPINALSVLPSPSAIN